MFREAGGLSTSSRDDGVRALNRLAAESPAGESGHGRAALNVGILGSEMEDHIHIPIAVDIFERRVYRRGLRPGCAESNCRRVYARSAKLCVRQYGYRNHAVAARVYAVRNALGLNVNQRKRAYFDTERARIIIGVPFIHLKAYRACEVRGQNRDERPRAAARADDLNGIA